MELEVVKGGKCSGECSCGGNRRCGRLRGDLERLVRQIRDLGPSRRRAPASADRELRESAEEIARRYGI